MRHSRRSVPANIYLFKVNNRNTKIRCEICSKLTIKTSEQRYWCCSGVFINFEHSFSVVDFEQVIVSWGISYLHWSSYYSECRNRLQLLRVVLFILFFVYITFNRTKIIHYSSECWITSEEIIPPLKMRINVVNIY